MIRSSTNEPRRVLHLPLTKARVNLGAVIKRVRTAKEYVILEKDGLPVAGLMDIDEFEDYLDSQDPGIRRHIAESAGDSRAGRRRSADRLLKELRGAETRATPTRKDAARKRP